MDAMNLPPGDAEVDTLSGGERRRVALCKILLERPDLLLLDEPTNHLDAESVAWLERHLAEYPGTVVAVTHDRYFLDNVAGWILELDRGHGIPWEGNYSSWLEQKQDRLAREEKAASVRQKTLDRELEWVRMSPRARVAKNKARLQPTRKCRPSRYDDREDELEIQIPPGKHLGDLVVEAQHVSKGYGDRLLIEDLSFRLPPGGIVGVIGANGAGKTTLFRMIMGHGKARSGRVPHRRHGRTRYVDQNRDALDPRKPSFRRSPAATTRSRWASRKVNARAYVARFNFKGPDQQKNRRQPVRRRAEPRPPGQAAATAAATCCSWTNRPTTSTSTRCGPWKRRSSNFAGCAVVISHDRWFLDRMATHILAFEGDSHVHWCEGNFETYEQQRRERLGIDADQPHRIRYKKLQH